MQRWTRRDVLKNGVAASLSGLLGTPTVASLHDAGEREEWDEGRPATLNLTALAGRERLLMDYGWRFQLGNTNEMARDFQYGHEDEYSKSSAFLAPSDRDYNDSGWRAIDLPHDWGVELPFVKDDLTSDYGFKPLGRAYPDTSIGWYRRTFDIPTSDLGRRISLEFDGVYRDCIVAFNGYFLGRHVSGYAPFRYDVTDMVAYGYKNVLVVRVDATQREGWFYAGAGMYRHAWLVKTNPVHVPQWGTCVTSEVRPGAATLQIATEVDNHSDPETPCRVVSTILNADGHVVGTARSAPTPVSGWSRSTVTQQVDITAPTLWSLEHPHLYRLITTVEAGGAELDRYETPFGIRSIRFDADQGFFLNGTSVKIQGTCNHQDHAGVGSALPDALQTFRIGRLKEMGCNAYRTSHNHPTPELLDACDRLGMLVMDETRTMSSSPGALDELRTLVRRDRNHPCVILWSVENEEPDESNDLGERVVTTMRRTVRQLDRTRPVTAAQIRGWGKGISSVLDVQGFNYGVKSGGVSPHIDDFRRQFPKQPCFGSEVASTLCTRGIYAPDTVNGYVAAYDRTPVGPSGPEAPWTSSAEDWWTLYDSRPYLAGGFVWTGFDYRGEPTPYQWPCISSHFGIMDTCGFPKDNYYYYQAWWSGKPVLHLFPHWNWAGNEGHEIEVWCHTNMDRVELVLNGKSLGMKDVPRNSHVAWMVKYAPGTLEAHGYTGGATSLVSKRETTGAPAIIRLTPDRLRIAANGDDVSVLEVQVLDAHRRVVPTADNEIAFHVSGNGRIIGVGNGDPSSHEPDKGEQRKAFNGVCMAIVQGTRQAGAIQVQATSHGLATATVTVQTTTATLRPLV